MIYQQLVSKTTGLLGLSFFVLKATKMVSDANRPYFNTFNVKMEMDTVLMGSFQNASLHVFNIM